MYPTLGSIAGHPISSFLLFLALGFALGTWQLVRIAGREGMDRGKVFDLGLYMLILGVLGARLAHVLFDGFLREYVLICFDPANLAWQSSAEACAAASGNFDAAASLCRPKGRDCLAWLAFWRGGLTYYGGFALAGAFSFFYCRRHSLPWLRVLDAGAIAIPCAHFFGRLGCFFGGCCFGAPCEAGLSFPSGSPASVLQHREGVLASAEHASLPVHPTQLYEAAGLLAIFLALRFCMYDRRRFAGQLFLSFLVLYSTLRFFVEFFRGDDRGLWAGLATSQWASLALVVASLLLYRWRKKDLHEAPKHLAELQGRG